MPSFNDPIDIPQDPYLIKRCLLSTELWSRFSIADLDVDFSRWRCVKMLNDDCSRIHEDIKKIPIKYGGIYVYVIRHPIIPSCGEYIMYVGRALKTKSENLRKRVNSYKKEINDDDRVRIHKLFKLWGKYTYVLYLPVKTNEDIIELEKRLISSIVPPCNADIPYKEVKRAVDAFI